LRPETNIDKLQTILRNGCSNYLRALDGLSRMFEVERNPTNYLTVLNQWASVKEQLKELEIHHTLDVENQWR